MTRRYFWVAAVALLCIMATAQFTSERLEVQTADEAVHLVAGYSILREGRFSLNAENPPVAKTLSAVPLLWLNPDLPHEPRAAGWMKTPSASPCRSSTAIAWARIACYFGADCPSFC